MAAEGERCFKSSAPLPRSWSLALKDMSFRPCVNPVFRLSERLREVFVRVSGKNRPKSGVETKRETAIKALRIRAM